MLVVLRELNLFELHQKRTLNALNRCRDWAKQIFTKYQETVPVTAGLQKYYWDLIKTESPQQKYHMDKMKIKLKMKPVWWPLWLLSGLFRQLCATEEKRAVKEHWSIPFLLHQNVNLKGRKKSELKPDDNLFTFQRTDLEAD